MFRAIVLYEQEPDAERYAQHVDDDIPAVPGAAFSHGRVLSAPVGDGRYHYLAEFSWADRESFQQGTSSDAFGAAAKDAMEMGIPFHVYFVETA